MKKFNLIIFLMVILAGMTFTSAALAEFPDKPLTYVICFDAGGESDITARIQQQALQDALGVPVVIVYKKGGGGAVGWSELMRTKPDGYTVYGTNLPHTIVQPMTRGNAGYETEKIDNIYMFEFTPDILAVSVDSEIKTVDDFIKYAKANPGISVGGSGQPSANSLGCEAFGKLTGLKLTYISFTGSGTAVPALLGGHVKALMTYTSMAAQYPDKIRPLAVAADKRAQALPNVPTFKELGYEFVEGAYRGVAVPPGTPKEIKKKLEQAFEKVNYDSGVIKKMEDLGFIMEYYGEDASKALVTQLTDYYGKLLKDLGLLKQ
ncbi:MAG TPA: tripartite tricarboxylate transporter substrate binding protein [Syntrophales bacterium]|nr:tripartite tricarboxylate transporter substrate binding protein [Syntrophales bacterium]HPQ43386.1 tripartite tricarboxylate transporter substrate binding protein [Syntrophales bacterium]